MKRKSCLFLIIFTSLQSAQQTFAQANKRESLSINFGPEMAFPEADFRQTHNIGYGASIKGEYTFGKHGSATINSGFSVFSGKTYFETISLLPTDYKSLVAIPIKAGARYYLGSFYASGEAGVVFLSKHINVSRPVVSIGIGDKIRIGQGKIDISLRQEFWLGNPKSLNMAILRVAYEIVW
jgi:hypothetical protein